MPNPDPYKYLTNKLCEAFDSLNNLDLDDDSKTLISSYVVHKMFATAVSFHLNGLQSNEEKEAALTKILKLVEASIRSKAGLPSVPSSFSEHINLN